MPFSRLLRLMTSLSSAAFLVNCGATYEMPNVDESVESRAKAIFAQAQEASPRQLSSATGGSNRFHRVARRVEPFAKALCESELAQGKDIDCNVRLEIDYKMDVRNAYFTYTEAGNKKPVIRFTMPMLRDAANDHEVVSSLI